MRKLGRKKSHRSSLMRNLATSLLLYEKVDTTEAKGKELKCYLEKVITSAKKNNLSTKQQIYGKLYDKNAGEKLFSEIIKRYENRASGFVTMKRLGQRLGDNSSIVRLELIDKKVFVESEKALKNPLKTILTKKPAQAKDKAEKEKVKK